MASAALCPVQTALQKLQTHFGPNTVRTADAKQTTLQTSLNHKQVQESFDDFTIGHREDANALYDIRPPLCIASSQSSRSLQCFPEQGLMLSLLGESCGVEHTRGGHNWAGEHTFQQALNAALTGFQASTTPCIWNLGCGLFPEYDLLKETLPHATCVAVDCYEPYIQALAQDSENKDIHPIVQADLSKPRAVQKLFKNDNIPKPNLVLFRHIYEPEAAKMLSNVGDYLKPGTRVLVTWHFESATRSLTQACEDAAHTTQLNIIQQGRTDQNPIQIQSEMIRDTIGTDLHYVVLEKRARS